MNVQLFLEFLFRYTALLAGVIVAVACITALLTPVRAVVRLIAAAPVSSLFTGLRALPNRHTRLGTKAAAGSVGLLDSKFGLAYFANFGYPFLEIGTLAFNFWTRYASASSFQKRAKAFTRTKAPTAPFWITNYLTAFFASYGRQVGLASNRDRSTVARTKLTGPGPMIPKRLATFRAFGIYTSVGALASPRAVNLLL